MGYILLFILFVIAEEIFYNKPKSNTKVVTLPDPDFPPPKQPTKKGGD